MIQSGDISAESLNWISDSIGVSNEEILSTGKKLRIESSQRTFFRIPFEDKSTILMVVPEGIDESIESFYTKAEVFKKANVNVPAIYFKNDFLGNLIVEDFGDDVLSVGSGDDWMTGDVGADLLRGRQVKTLGVAELVALG